MLAHTLILIAGFLALPGWSFITRPAKAPVDTISDCTSWAIAQPQDTCQLLAEKNHIPLNQLHRWNPALQRNCEATPGWSYCIANSTADYELDIRQSSTQKTMQGLITALYIVVNLAPPELTMLQELWDARVMPLFNSLSYASIVDWLLNSPDGQEAKQRMDQVSLAQWLACNLPSLNSLVGSWGGQPAPAFPCFCYDEDTCCSPTETCNFPATKKRLGRTVSLGLLEDRSHLKDRAGASTIEWSGTRNGIAQSGSFAAPSYPASRDFAFTDPIWQQVFTMDLIDDCTALTITTVDHPDILLAIGVGEITVTDVNFAQVELFIERNTIGLFFSACINGELDSGGTFQAGLNIPVQFFTQFMSSQVPDIGNFATVDGGASITVPIDRLMNVLGSNANRANLMLMASSLVAMKTRALTPGSGLISGQRVQAARNRDPPREFLVYNRQAFNLFSFLQHPTALLKGNAILRAIRWELSVYQRIYNEQFFDNIDVVTAWDTWFLDHMENDVISAAATVQEWIDDYNNINADNTPNSLTAQAVLGFYASQLRSVTGWNNPGYPVGAPTSPTSP